MTRLPWKSVCLACVLVAAASASRRSPGVQEVSLPADYTIDFQLGLANRNKMMAGSSEITGTPYNEIGDQVFRRLIGSGFNLPYSWKLSLVSNQAVNASSSAAGQVYVYGGMLPNLGTIPGLWAAVLSHEVAHTALRHQVRDYLQHVYIQQMVQYYRYRIQVGDKSANWALAGFSIAAPIALKKMEREQEHQADQQGMLSMARAGYHPDYVFALHHLLMMKVGDQSKFGAFFSNHPRWATRDQRDERLYVEAVAEFNQLWPNPAVSPGGSPPVVAFMGQPTSVEDKANGTADIAIPVYCRNATQPVGLVLVFEKDGRPIPAANPAFANKSSNAVYAATTSCGDKEANSPVAFRVPADAVPDRSVKAFAFVVVGDMPIAASHAFDVKFPKAVSSTTGVTQAPAAPKVAMPEMIAGGPVSSHPTTVSGPSGAANDGTVSITSIPNGAEVFIDSIGHGHAPQMLKLSPGKHSVQLVMQGYKDWSAEVIVNGNSILNVAGSLRK